MLVVEFRWDWEEIRRFSFEIGNSFYSLCNKHAYITYFKYLMRADKIISENKKRVIYFITRIIYIQQ